jgi:hypothetical protein
MTTIPIAPALHFRLSGLLAFQQRHERSSPRSVLARGKGARSSFPIARPLHSPETLARPRRANANGQPERAPRQRATRTLNPNARHAHANANAHA